jgi:PAS domain S-box-containing protein
VELTLQHEQLEQSQIEIAEALDRYVERFDFAPVGYFSVEPDGRIIEGNLAGGEMFEIDKSEFGGQPIENFVAAESREALRSLLDGLRNGRSCEPCEVHPKHNAGLPRVLRVMANASPRARYFYLTFTDVSDCK